jgi:cytochrome oxidase Cu insertion factor (SCO1/SenC/PrrC family)
VSPGDSGRARRCGDHASSWRGSVARAVVVCAVGAALTPAACASARSAPTFRAPAAEERVSLFAHPWTWTDERGQAVAFARWRGETLVLTAIYTRCGSTCPRTIGKLKSLEATLRQEGRAAIFLLVSLAPSEDTAEVRRRFKESQQLPTSWHVLAGGERDTAELVDLLGIHIIDDGPHLMHDAKILIFDREGIEQTQLAGWALDAETRLK